MKYVVRRNENFVLIDEKMEGTNWSKYAIVGTIEQATKFDTEEEAQKVVEAIKEEFNRDISRLRSKQKIQSLKGMFEYIGEPCVEKVIKTNGV